jgi:hypothetical protein
MQSSREINTPEHGLPLNLLNRGSSALPLPYKDTIPKRQFKSTDVEFANIHDALKSQMYEN